LPAEVIENKQRTDEKYVRAAGGLDDRGCYGYNKINCVNPIEKGEKPCSIS